MKFKRFMALALAGVMTLAMAGTTMAANDADDHQVISGGLEFTKNATAASSVSSINSNAIFTLADTGAFAIKDTKGNTVTYDKAGELNFGDDATITVLASELTGGNGTFTAEKQIDTAIKTAIGKVGKPGVYYATLTESTPVATESDNYFGWTQVSDKTYYIAAFATKAESGYDVKYVAYEAGENGADLDNKTTELKFSNTYNKKSGKDDEEGKTPSFKLKKVVENPEYVAADTTYSFSVAITLPETAAKDNEGNKICKAKATVTGTGTVAKNAITGDETALAVTLQKDAELTIDDLPVGTTVTITENVSGLVGKNFEKAEFGADAKTKETTSDKVISDGVTLDEDGANVTCTNTFKSITPTGLAISVAPFVAMFAAVGAAIALYVAAKRRVR